MHLSNDSVRGRGRRRRRGGRALTPLAVVAALATSLGAQAPAAAGDADEATPLVRWSLLNGLEVALVQRQTPAVAVQVWYRAGSKNDPPEKRGVAHMFEHLMYQGSKRVRPEGHTRLLHQVGGHSNALTTEDATAFADLVPVDQLELALDLEAERMRSLLFRDSEIATQKKRVAAEARRDRQNPLYAAVLRFLPVAFPGHPYSWTSGGVPGDIGRITRKDLESFYESHYRPNQALLVIVGNVDEKRARAAVDRAFSGLERGPDLAAPPSPGPVKTGRVVAEPARLGFVMHGYRIPAAGDDDIYPLQLLSLILTRGDSSRLYRHLVDGKLAVEAGGQAIVRQQPGLFMVFGAFTKPGEGKDVEKALDAEISRVRRTPVSAAELERARNQARAALGFASLGIDGMAQQIGTSWALTGDPGRFSADLEKLGGVTAADIERVAGKYLTADKRATLVIPVGAAKRDQPKGDQK